MIERYMVTESQWSRVMHDDSFNGSMFPMLMVSATQADEFCVQRTAMEIQDAESRGDLGLAASLRRAPWRLPTVREWGAHYDAHPIGMGLMCWTATTSSAGQGVRYIFGGSRDWRPGWREQPYNQTVRDTHTSWEIGFFCARDEEHEATLQPLTEHLKKVVAEVVGRLNAVLQASGDETSRG